MTEAFFVNPFYANRSSFTKGLRLRCVPADLFLVFSRKRIEPVEVNLIGIVCAYGVFAFVLLPLNGQAIGHFPLFVQGVYVNGESIFHGRGK